MNTEPTIEDIRAAERLIGEPVPTCDICDGPEDHRPALFYDWNGETGNHISCELGEKSGAAQ